MKKFFLFISVVIALSGCGQTSESSKTSKPQSAPQVKTQLETKPSYADRVQSLPQQSSDKVTKQIVTQETLASLRAQISNIEMANECDNSMQCEVIAAGSRACGGPSHYMIYSTKYTPKEKALSIASELTKYESLYNAQNDMQSICAMLTKPGTQCSNNKCVKLSNSNELAY
jgi:hypothetical protein